MVKRLLVRLVYEYGSKALNSVFKAYKETVKQAPKNTANKNQQDESEKNKQNESKSPFGKFNFGTLISSPMTKDEALKILNLKEPENTPENIMQKFEKYFESNDPMKGGSFYIQNKLYYAKEFLMEKFPKDLNVSRFNPDATGKEQKQEDKQDDKDKEQQDSSTGNTKEDLIEKNKNDKI
jgi:hypothetical protein